MAKPIDIFRLNKWGNFERQLTSNNVFDGEAALSADGKLVVFTSTRNGDPDLWIMTAEDGSNARQVYPCSFQRRITRLEL